MEKFTKVRHIGKGNMGACALARNNEDGKFYVIKQVDLSRMSKKERQQSLNEAHLLSSLQHPNIINYVDSFLSKKSDYLCIVMEFADSGDLSARIKKSYGVNFREPQVLDWMIQLALSLSYVHQRKILHRDIKSQNVFLTSQNIVKLGDFGIARTLSGTYDQAKTFVGTPYYLSPELILERPYDHRSDVWALGVVVYELMTLKHPFNATSMKGLMQRILKVQYEPVPKLYTQEMRNIIPRLLAREPSQRIKLEELLELPIVHRRMREWMLTDVMPKSYIDTLVEKNLLPPSISVLRKIAAASTDLPTYDKTDPSSPTGGNTSRVPSLGGPSSEVVDAHVISERPERVPLPVLQRQLPPRELLVHQQQQQQQQQQAQKPVPLSLQPPHQQQQQAQRSLPLPVQHPQLQQQAQQHRLYQNGMRKPSTEASYVSALRMPKRTKPLYLMYKNINGGYNSPAIPGAARHGPRISGSGPSLTPSTSAIHRNENSQLPQLSIGGVQPPSLPLGPSHGHVDAGNAASIPASNPFSNRPGPNTHAVGGLLSRPQTDVDNKEGLGQQYPEHRVRKRSQQGSGGVASCLNPFFQQPSNGLTPVPSVSGSPSMDIKAMLQRAALERAQRRAYP